MIKDHPVKVIIGLQKKGISKGICSICSSNEYVIEATMERALLEGESILIEATANQVNQYGGYTGMTPTRFKEFVLSIARRLEFPQEMVIFGGDHLGPLTWKSENSCSAMEKATELVKQYVLAGFSKIHIDTTMKLGDDSANMQLSTEVIAERCALLCKEAETAFEELKKADADAMHPVYIIGSEVPIPGGSQDQCEELKVTEVSDFIVSINAFKNAFEKLGINNAWENVVAVVVQPGVEFGDNIVYNYSREATRELSNCIKNFPGIVFEGHSTDYQKASSLKEMVEDGIAILKVGPALTFALREALFSHICIEGELLGEKGSFELSHFIQTLDSEMVKGPEQWKNHYAGDEVEVRLARKYSYSDRCRYYLPIAEVKKSIKQLVANLRSVNIPLTMLSQFMPMQYNKIRSGLLENDPEALIKDKINTVLDNYYYAVKPLEAHSQNR